MSAISFRINEHFDEFIESLIKSGRYASKTDVMLAALRSLEDAEMAREAHMAELKTAIAEGDQQIAKGQWTEYTRAELTNKIKQEGRERLKKT